MTPVELSDRIQRTGIAPERARAVTLALFNHWPSPTTEPFAFEWQALALEHGGDEVARVVADAIAVTAS